MISFHGSNLVPEELCRLLYLTVPEEHHTPIVFDSRKIVPSSSYERYPLGEHYPDGHIEVHLNKLIDAVLDPLQRNHASYASALWYETLHTCYHEFGHHAHRSEVARQPEHVRFDLYRYRWSETFADQWAERRIAELGDHDPRLGQPVPLTGYLGVRFERLM